MMGIDFTKQARELGLQLMCNAAKALPLSCACKRIPQQQEKKA